MWTHENKSTLLTHAQAQNTIQQKNRTALRQSEKQYWEKKETFCEESKQNSREMLKGWQARNGHATKNHKIERNVELIHGTNNFQEKENASRKKNASRKENASGKEKSGTTNSKTIRQEKNNVLTEMLRWHQTGDDHATENTFSEKEFESYQAGKSPALKESLRVTMLREHESECIEATPRQLNEEKRESNNVIKTSMNIQETK